MEWLGSYVVVDPRLAAPRGEQYSVSAVENTLNDDFVNEPETDIGDTAAASIDSIIPESNVGFKMLQKMGWKGKGLGREETGIVEPVKAGVDSGVRLGLGKQEQDDFYTNTENLQRKKLEVEIQANEDPERARKRELQAERELRIKQEVADIKKSFYCEMCHKQYNTAMEMETHLSSYDHHHRKRMLEMKAMQSERTREERMKKQKKQLSKEMARFNDQLKRAQAAQLAVIPTPLPEVAPNESISASSTEQCVLEPTLPLETSPAIVGTDASGMTLSFNLTTARGRGPLAGKGLAVKRSALPPPLQPLSKLSKSG